MELTKEYVIAHSKLTEADFEGVDFKDFVTRFALTPERLEQYEPTMLLGLYRNMLKREPTVDYTGLYRLAQGKLDEKDLKAVETLIWEFHSGSYNSAMVIDGKGGAVYYGQGCFLNACGESKRVADFGREDAAFLEKALRESGICTWEEEYNGTDEGTTGSFGWAIGIRLQDGRCVRYSGHGVRNSGTPETMRPLLKALIGRFTGK